MKCNVKIMQAIRVSRLLMILLLPYGIAEAQLCTGSLGDPVVHIDFGSGLDRPDELGPRITSYEYSKEGELDEGVYTISYTTKGLKGEAWHLTSDHTGNPYGRMMIVNCALFDGEGTFYTLPIGNLCANTTYEFSAWIMNTMTKVSSNPNVTFRITTQPGEILGTFNTGQLPYTIGPEWKQYGFFFNTGNETSVRVTILNSAPSARPGNDLALDDITFRPCGPLLNVNIDGAGLTRSICKGDPSVFTFRGTLSTGYSDPVYQWQISTDSGTIWTDINGAVTDTYTRNPTATGFYLYRLSAVERNNMASMFCRVASDQLTIDIPEDPLPLAASNSPGCIGDTLRLNAADIGISYQWTGPAGFTASGKNPVLNSLTPVNNGFYRVKLTTALGCTGNDSTKIEVDTNPTVHAGPDAAICEGASVVLQGGGNGSEFSWSPVAGLSNPLVARPRASPSDSTAYVLTASNGLCRHKDTVNIFVWKKPTANAGSDKAIFEGNSVPLDGQAGGTDIHYSWSGDYTLSSTIALHPFVKPPLDMTYTLRVNSDHGCAPASDNVFVRVYNTIKIPNAFSPNNDGINDTWSIAKLYTYPDADISVFNRYGQVVFHSKGYTKEWDGRTNGKDLPVGTYYYVINLKTGFGNTTGWVAILR